MKPRALWAVATVLCWPGVVAAQSIRVGEHGGYSRVVFDLPASIEADVSTGGGGVQLALPGAGTLPVPATLPRWLVSLKTGPDTAALILAPGARASVSRLDTRVVIDIRQTQPAVPPKAPPAGRPTATDARQKLGPAKPAGSAPVLDSTAPGPAGTVKPGSLPEPATTPSAPVPPSATPQDAGDRSALVPPPLRTDAGPADGAVPTHGDAVPATTVEGANAAAPPGTAPDPVPPPLAAPVKVGADIDVGAAAFRRGGLGLVVFDRRLTTLPQPPGVSWTQGPVSTILQVPLGSDQHLALTRTAEGWSVAVAAGEGLNGTVQPAPVRGLTGLPFEHPGRVVTIIDPVSGGQVLVGTSRVSGADLAVAATRRTPSFALLPTWLGIALEALSDRVDVRPNSDGFAIAGADPLPATGAANWTLRFQFPSLPPEALLNRLHAQLAGAAAAPPRARTVDRTGAARTMISLGLDAEAHGVLLMTAADDPQAAADAELSALAAVAAVLTGRTTEAGGLDDPRLDGTDEVAFWRGLRDRRRGVDSAAARDLGRLAMLATTYPARLRDQVFPEAAEAAVEAGLRLPDDIVPPLARAIQLERDGDVEKALAAYNGVASDADRLAGARSAVRAIELRLSAGQIGPIDAAGLLERRIFDWRGEPGEAAMMLRTAELRSNGKDWRGAIDLLRTVDAQFPERRAAVLAQESATVRAMLEAQGVGMSALDLVLLAAEHPEALPDGVAGTTMARLLADKLMALDLPSRAIPILQGLIRATATGPARAEFGARLAQLLLEGSSPADAATALQASAAVDLPPDLAEMRTLLLARARAGQGDLAASLSLLRGVGTDAADELRASLLASSGDLAGSLSALKDLAARRVASEGPLSDNAQDLLLRQASLAARLQDTAALRSLAPSARRLDGPRADLFRTLTAEPVASPRDLSRANRELALARTVPDRLQAWPGR